MSSAPPSDDGSATVAGQPDQESGGRLRVRNWRLRNKLLAVLLIPSIAAVVLGGIQVVNNVESVRSLNRVSENVRLETKAATLIHELQRERDLTVAYVASNRGVDPNPMRQQRGRVDNAVNGLKTAAGGANEDVASPYQDAVGDLTNLKVLRQAAENSAYPPEGLLRTYTTDIDQLASLSQRNVSQVRDPGLLRTALATNALATAKEAASTQRAMLSAALHQGEFRPEQDRELLSTRAELETAIEDYENWASPAQQQDYRDTVTGLPVDEARSTEEIALAFDSTDRSLNTLNPDAWDAAATEHVNLIGEVADARRNELRQQADSAASAATQQTIITGVATGGSIILAFVIALFMARSLLLPLRTLRRSALEVADRRLPETVQEILHNPKPEVADRAQIAPIPVYTREEIGRVARSFDEVHSQALKLASEQALLRNNVNDLFVNLARRSQTLVQRQLSLIDRLEQDEQDPDQLSSLFELDHLATRMRRNNENLLILGGTDLTRRMMRPVPLAEVVGAAVSEVEQYARIAVADSPDLAIQGRVVNDFVHLVAELLENATVFSNPDTEVTVRTAYRRQELLLEIRDRGVGIDGEDLIEINDRLVSPPEVDVAVSRRMGLYVVGQLARRHRLRVDLQNNADLEGGVTANVHLSGEYVVQVTPDGQHLPMPDVQRGSLEQRDPLTDSGTHLGLAAAFGRGGVADLSGGRGPDELPEAPAQPPTQAPVEAWEPSNGFMPAPEPFGGTGEGEPVDAAGESTEKVPADYSFRVSNSGSFAASEVPRWEEQQDWPSEETPGVEVSNADAPEVQAFGAPVEGAEGQCGLPPEMTATANLFRSPFESEKTAKVEPAEEHAWPDDAADQTGGNGYAAVTSQSGGASAAREMDDAPTERLPIYEAVLSQWFREEDDSGAVPAPADQASARPGDFDSVIGSAFSANTDAAQSTNGASRQAHVEEPSATAEPTADSSGIGEFGEAPSDQPESALEVAPAADESAATGETPDPGWGSADAGWQAAEALVDQSKQVPETTSAGLPKRVPKSNLVPGSAAAKPESIQPSKPAAPRSPDAVRGRMSNFQQGISRGRHAKAEPVSTDKPTSNPSRHEEQQ